MLPRSAPIGVLKTLGTPLAEHWYRHQCLAKLSNISRACDIFCRTTLSRTSCNIPLPARQVATMESLLPLRLPGSVCPAPLSPTFGTSQKSTRPGSYERPHSRLRGPARLACAHSLGRAKVKPPVPPPLSGAAGFRHLSLQCLDFLNTAPRRKRSCSIDSRMSLRALWVSVFLGARCASLGYHRWLRARTVETSTST